MLMTKRGLLWRGREGDGLLEILCRSLASEAADLNDVRRVVPARFEVVIAHLIKVIDCWGRALFRLVDASGQLAASIIRVIAFNGT
jgi:hypothetical protein